MLSCVNKRSTSSSLVKYLLSTWILILHVHVDCCMRWASCSRCSCWWYIIVVSGPVQWFRGIATLMHMCGIIIVITLLLCCDHSAAVMKASLSWWVVVVLLFGVFANWHCHYGAYYLSIIVIEHGCHGFSVYFPCISSCKSNSLRNNKQFEEYWWVMLKIALWIYADIFCDSISVTYSPFFGIIACWKTSLNM